ncbi:MAG TPA: isochorismatase family cysteine hydrolase [Levilinea sp.]|nr:isochorismatase family cysteine hydrolase [Levilinea sp.]
MPTHTLSLKSVEVPEIPIKETVALPASKSAVIVVDMQNDFVKPQGSLLVPGAQETVSRIARLLGNARRSGVKIAYTQDSQVENDPEFDIWPVHVLIGTWGWQIIDDLKPLADDLVCPKNRYDGFHESWLDHFISRIWKVENVVIVGTVASICVLHTAASAALRWLHVVMPADGISALTEFDTALTLRQVSWLYAGSVVNSVDDIQFSA